MLTTEQLAILATEIDSNPDLADFVLNHDATLIAEYYNVTATPDYTVWRTDVSMEEIMRNGMDWARVDNLSVGKARIWDWIGKLGYFDASKPNIRAGIDAAWVGAAADLAVRANIYTHCKRPALRGEKLFAIGTGTVASPATMEVEGQLRDIDIQQAKNW